MITIPFELMLSLGIGSFILSIFFAMRQRKQETGNAEKTLSPIVRMLEPRHLRVLYALAFSSLGTTALIPSLRDQFSSADGAILLNLNGVTLFTLMIFLALYVVCYGALTQSMRCGRRVPDRARQAVSFCLIAYLLYLLPILTIMFSFFTRNDGWIYLLFSSIQMSLVVAFTLSLIIREMLNYLYKKIFRDPFGIMNYMRGD